MVISQLLLEHATFRYEPYPIGLARPIFDDDRYAELLAAWPPHDLFAFKPALGKKYSLSEVNNASEYEAFVAGSPLWKDIHAQIKSPEFVQRVLKVLRDANIDLGIPKDVAVNQPAKPESCPPRWQAALQPQRAA